MNKLIERIKRAVNDIKTEFTVTTMRVLSGDKDALSKGERRTFVGSAAVATVIFSTGVAHADVLDSIEQEFGTLTGRIVAFSAKAAALCAVIAFLWLIFTPNSRKAEGPITWLKYIFLGFAGIAVVGGIFTFIKGILGSSYGYETIQ